jgi:hypothetical protein
VRASWLDDLKAWLEDDSGACPEGAHRWRVPCPVLSDIGTGRRSSRLVTGSFKTTADQPARAEDRQPSGAAGSY